MIHFFVIEFMFLTSDATRVTYMNRPAPHTFTHWAGSACRISAAVPSPTVGLCHAPMTRSVTTVVLVFSYVTSDTPPMIVIELADCSLSDRLAKEECSQDSLIKWAHEVSMAMVRDA